MDIFQAYSCTSALTWIACLANIFAISDNSINGIRYRSTNTTRVKLAYHTPAEKCWYTYVKTCRHLQIKNDRNGGIWQSGISKSLAEYVQRPVCSINVQSSLHENVVFSVCALMDNAAYVEFRFRLRAMVSFPV